MRSAHIVRGTSRLVTSIASSIPGLGLLLVYGWMLAFAAPGLAAVLFAVAVPVGGDPQRMVGFVALAALPVALVTAPSLAAAVARYVNHLVPVRADGRKRPLGVALVVALAALGVVAAWVAVVVVPARWSDLPPRIVHAFVAVPVLAFFACELLMLGRTFLGPTVPDRYVLFLRRFQSFSDREVVASVLRATSGRLPVVLLLSPVRGPGNWDPMTVSLAGATVIAPWRTLPRFLVAGDEAWEREVARLIDGATSIVVDTTARSESVGAELHLLRSLGALDRTIALVEEAPDAPCAGGVEATFTVSYARAWRWATPRIALSALAALAVTGLARWLVEAGSLPVPEWRSLPGLAFVAACTILASSTFATVARPGLPPRVAKEVRRYLDLLLARAGGR